MYELFEHFIFNLCLSFDVTGLNNSNWLLGLIAALSERSVSLLKASSTAYYNVPIDIFKMV